MNLTTLATATGIYLTVGATLAAVCITTTARNDSSGDAALAAIAIGAGLLIAWPVVAPAVTITLTRQRRTDRQLREHRRQPQH